MNKNHEPVSVSRLVVLFAGGVAVVLGLTVLVGWYTRTTMLIQIHSTFVPMQYNTALGFLLCGAGVLLTALGYRRSAFVCGSIVCALGLLTMIQYFFGVNLGIDELLMDHSITMKTSHPGRIAPNTALAFILTGAALMSIGRKRGGSPTSMGALGALIAALGVVAILGYVMGMETAYGWGRLTRMALHTAVGFSVLGGGVIAFAWHYNRARGRPSFLWLLPVAILGTMTATVCMWQALDAHKRATIARQLTWRDTTGVDSPTSEGLVWDPSFLPLMALVGGVLISGLVGLTVLFAERRRAAESLRASYEQLRRRFSGLSRDITERKEAEEVLRQRSQELAASNTELEQFAYVASHDLQEPLRMITSYVQLLSERYKGQLDTDADEFIAFAVDGAKRLQRLIDGLLTLSRVGTRGKAFAPTDCETAVDATLAGLRFAIDENSARITRDPLPTVIADEVQIGQLFQNLIGNALKFRGEDPPRIHISAQKNNGQWVFSVSDNGIGIDSQHIARIFLIFQRLHNRDKYEGTGIGLAVCKKIVERHGGRLWVESKPGQGSTFYFTIPASDRELP